MSAEDKENTRLELLKKLEAFGQQAVWRYNPAASWWSLSDWWQRKSIHEWSKSIPAKTLYQTADAYQGQSRSFWGSLWSYFFPSRDTDLLVAYYHRYHSLLSNPYLQVSAADHYTASALGFFSPLTTLVEEMEMFLFEGIVKAVKQISTWVGSLEHHPSSEDSPYTEASQEVEGIGQSALNKLLKVYQNPKLSLTEQNQQAKTIYSKMDEEIRTCTLSLLFSDDPTFRDERYDLDNLVDDYQQIGQQIAQMREKGQARLRLLMQVYEDVSTPEEQRLRLEEKRVLLVEAQQAKDKGLAQFKRRLTKPLLEGFSEQLQAHHEAEIKLGEFITHVSLLWHAVKLQASEHCQNGRLSNEKRQQLLQEAIQRVEQTVHKLMKEAKPIRGLPHQPDYNFFAKAIAEKAQQDLWVYLHPERAQLVRFQMPSIEKREQALLDYTHRSHLVQQVRCQQQDRHWQLLIKASELQQNTTKGYSFIWVKELPVNNNLTSLPGETDMTYLLTQKNELYYVDKLEKKLTLITADSVVLKNLAEALELTLPLEKESECLIPKLSAPQLEAIHQLSGHNPDKKVIFLKEILQAASEYYRSHIQRYHSDTSSWPHWLSEKNRLHLAELIYEQCLKLNEWYKSLQQAIHQKLFPEKEEVKFKDLDEVFCYPELFTEEQLNGLRVLSEMRRQQRVEIEQLQEMIQENQKVFEKEKKEQQAELEKQKKEQQAELEKQKKEQQAELEKQKKEQQAELEKQKKEQQAELEKQKKEQQAELEKQKKEQQVELEKQKQINEQQNQTIGDLLKEFKELKQSLQPNQIKPDPQRFSQSQHILFSAPLQQLSQNDSQKGEDKEQIPIKTENKTENQQSSNPPNPSLTSSGGNQG